MREMDINVLVVDDEPFVLDQTKRKIEIFVPNKKIYCATNSVEVMRIVKSVPVDLAFLDIELSDTDGFFIADYIREKQPNTRYVFLTGHVELGAKSYEYEPLDFLCKPLDVIRLEKTFERYQKYMSHYENKDEKVAIEGQSGFVIISPKDINYITRENRKVFVYLDEGKHVVKGTLDELELIFNDFQIVRCHQSYLVSLGKIRSVLPDDFGRTYWALLTNGEKIPVSRAYYLVLKNEMEQSGAKFL